MPNDTNAYPEDFFDNMKAFSAKHRFTFPYVIDATQKVARADEAQRTPDFCSTEVGSMPRAQRPSRMLARPIRGNEKG
jgi:hypothetical protein